MTAEKRVVLCGGSGLIGRSLASVLRAGGCDVCVLTRAPDRDASDVCFVHWDGRTDGPWSLALDGAHAVINLTGRSIDCVLTRKNRRAILDSRVDSVRVLQRAVAGVAVPPETIVQCSAVGYYGDTQTSCDESAPHGTGFLAETCLAWEQAFDSSDFKGARKVKFRIGVVLDREDGALAKLARLARLFLGGHVGSGKQWMSWIHISDLSRMFLHAMAQPETKGVFNAVSPNPVTNAVFMRKLRRAIHRPWSPPVPTPAVRLGALLMGSNSLLALTGQRCVPGAFLAQGFAYDFPMLDDALQNLLYATGQSTCPEPGAHTRRRRIFANHRGQTMYPK